MYKAFVDNYKVALETAEKCSQSNNQFQKISEVGSSLALPPLQLRVLRGWSEPSRLRASLSCLPVRKIVLLMGNGLTFAFLPLTFSFLI